MFDFTSFLSHLQHLDPISAIVGAIAAPIIVGAIIKAIKPIPALLAGRVKAAISKAAANGKIDEPTQRLFGKLWRAAFEWADEELPDEIGPEKMEAILDKAATLPYIGGLVRYDRAGARQILQAEFEAMKAEAKAEGAADPILVPVAAPVSPAAQ